jgi:hypothetical protein
VLPTSVLVVAGKLMGHTPLEGELRGLSTKAQRPTTFAHAWEGVVAGAVVVPKVRTSVLVVPAEMLASVPKVGKTEVGDMALARL